MLPNVLRPNATDHVPVLADEVREALAVEPGRDRRRRDLRSRRARGVARCRPRGSGKLIAIDRDPAVRPYFDRVRKQMGVQGRFLRGEFSLVLEQLAANGVRADAILFDLGVSSDADRPPGARLLVRHRRTARHADGSRVRALGARARQHGERARADADLQGLRRRALCAAGRASDRSPPPRAAVRADRRAGRDDQGGDPGTRALRRRASGQAGLPGSAHRRQRRARLDRGGAAGRRSRCCAPRVASPWSASTRSRIGSSSASCAPRRKAARVRRTSLSASAATNPRCGRSRAGRSRPRRQELAANPRASSARLRAAVKSGGRIAVASWSDAAPALPSPQPRPAAEAEARAQTAPARPAPAWACRRRRLDRGHRRSCWPAS